MDEDKNRENEQEVDALCPECGHGFKAYVDRLLVDGKSPDQVGTPLPWRATGFSSQSNAG